MRFVSSELCFPVTIQSGASAPSIQHLISIDPSLPAGPGTRTSAIADERAEVWFPWKLSSEDTNLIHRKDYKILGNTVINVSNGEGTDDDNTGSREVVMPFYFKMNRRITLTAPPTSTSNVPFMGAPWLPFIFFYTSHNEAAKKAELQWEGRLYWKNLE